MGLFSSKKSSYGLNRIKAERYRNSDYSPKIGEDVKLWRKPDTNNLNIYPYGTVGGMGLLGWFDDPFIADHISKDGIYEAKIEQLSGSQIKLNVNLVNEFVDYEKLKKEADESMRGRLSKNYNPQTEWTLKFEMIDGFKKSKDLKFGHWEMDKILDRLNDLEKSIWIEDKEGNRVSKDSWPGRQEVIKTIRVINSGHSIKINSIRKEGIFYHFTIGI